MINVPSGSEQHAAYWWAVWHMLACDLLKLVSINWNWNVTVSVRLSVTLSHSAFARCRRVNICHCQEVSVCEIASPVGESVRVGKGNGYKHVFVWAILVVLVHSLAGITQKYVTTSIEVHSRVNSSRGCFMDRLHLQNVGQIDVPFPGLQLPYFKKLTPEISELNPAFKKIRGKTGRWAIDTQPPKLGYRRRKIYCRRKST